MKTIVGLVVSAALRGKTAEIQTKLGTYGINRVVRGLVDFKNPLRKGDNVELVVDDEQNNTLLSIKEI